LRDKISVIAEAWLALQATMILCSLEKLEIYCVNVQRTSRIS